MDVFIPDLWVASLHLLGGRGRMSPETIEAEGSLEDAFEGIVVLEPRSSYPEDDLIMPGEFDIA
jgi:hypothetical protein